MSAAAGGRRNESLQRSPLIWMLRDIARNSKARRDAAAAVHAAQPDTPEAAAAVRRLAELDLRAVASSSEETARVLAEVIRTADERALHFVVNAIETCRRASMDASIDAVG